MIFRLRIISDEVKDFAREILIDCNHTFLDFHQVLQENLKYDPGQLASFFMTNEHWEKELQITLIDMKDDESNSVITMDIANIGDYLKKKGQRMLYIFDFFSERSFFIELTEIITIPANKGLPKIVFEHGSPPEQINLSLDDLDFSDADLDISDGSNEDFLSDIDIDNLDDLPNE